MLKPDEALLWINLGYRTGGPQKYDDAITSYKKALDLENASKKPRVVRSRLAKQVWARSTLEQERFLMPMLPTMLLQRPTRRRRLASSQRGGHFLPGEQRRGSNGGCRGGHQVDPNQSDPNLRSFTTSRARD